MLIGMLHIVFPFPPTEGGKSFPSGASGHKTELCKTSIFAEGFECVRAGGHLGPGSQSLENYGTVSASTDCVILNQNN